jgi:hypothetical protein
MSTKGKSMLAVPGYYSAHTPLSITPMQVRKRTCTYIRLVWMQSVHYEYLLLVLNLFCNQTLYSGRL